MEELAAEYVAKDGAQYEASKAKFALSQLLAEQRIRSASLMKEALALLDQIGPTGARQTFDPVTGLDRPQERWHPYTN